MKKTHLGILAFGGLALVWLSLGVLTIIGARRRGHDWLIALLAGPLFPLTWVIWYLTDEEAAGGRATRQLRRYGP